VRVRGRPEVERVLGFDFGPRRKEPTLGLPELPASMAARVAGPEAALPYPTRGLCAEGPIFHSAAPGWCGEEASWC